MEQHKYWLEGLSVSSYRQQRYKQAKISFIILPAAWDWVRPRGCVKKPRQIAEQVLFRTGNSHILF
jgi:hypothetical protein